MKTMNKPHRVPVVTEAEHVLRGALETEQIPFVVQGLVKTVHGEFLVDFLIADCIVVEIDGSSHFFGRKCREKDHWKTAELEREGLQVLRFRNIEVFKNLPYVLRKIREAYREITPNIEVTTK